MPERKTVMISSTARDLPEHRKEAMDACLRQGMFPVMMEHLPASDAEAISASLAMVDAADIYVGILAHRYGYVPAGHAISVTEMEYDRAVERKIPRLIFLMDKTHPITIDQVELGEGAARLEAFKKRLQADNIVNFFKSPADLRALVINSLSQLREPDLTAFHYVSDIPAPPEAYIAHPYTLLQTHRLVGRQAELNLLTDWVAGKTFEVSETSKVSIFNIVAIGGMGKSALAWKWFNDIAPQEMRPLAGRMWWSFYESDATFENFVIRALAYVTGRAREDVEKNVKPGEREEQLLAALDRGPFLLVLDGLERILIAYARMDAARLADDDFDRQTANYVARAYGLPESAGQSFTGQHLLRKTADPRTGAFLRKLAGVRASRPGEHAALPRRLAGDHGRPLPRLRRALPARAERGRRAGAVARVRRERRPRDAAAALRQVRAAPAADPGAGQPGRGVPPRAGRFRAVAPRPPRLFAGRPAAGAGQVARAGICAAWAGRQSARGPADHRRVPHAGAVRHPRRAAGGSLPCRSGGGPGWG